MVQAGHDRIDKEASPASYEGRWNHWERWARSYQISYKRTNVSDTIVIDEIFTGNSVDRVKVVNLLPANTVAQIVRLEALTYNLNACLRWDLIGSPVTRKFRLQ